MGRQDTFNRSSKRKPTPPKEKSIVLEDFENQKIVEENIGFPKTIENQIEAPVFEPKPSVDVQTHNKPIKANKSKPNVFQELIEEKEKNVPRSWQALPEVSEALDELFRNPQTKKLYKGARGKMTILMNNAIIKELVDMGYWDEEKLNLLESYK